MLPLTQFCNASIHYAGIIQCNGDLANSHQHVVDYFHPHPMNEVGRSDVSSLLAESLFNCLLAELTPRDMFEIDSYISLLERDMCVTFPPRTIGTLPPLMRLHYDPVVAYSKPLLYYAAVTGADLCSDLVLWCLGFRKREAGTLSCWVLGSDQSSDDGSAGARQAQPPVMFVHGVGLGLVTYIAFITSLVAAYSPGTRPALLLLELPHVSMKLSVEAVPTMPETVRGIASVLQGLGSSQAQFVAHSLGCFVLAAVQLYQPGLVAGAVLVDPVCFKLWEPSVMRNFCYRVPRTPMQILMHYHITHELTISHYFHRHFLWTDCVMFAHNMPARSCVVLSELDEIIDTAGVQRYLQGHPAVRLRVLAGRHHGEWSVHPGARRAVIGEVLRMSDLLLLRDDLP